MALVHFAGTVVAACGTELIKLHDHFPSVGVPHGRAKGSLGVSGSATPADLVSRISGRIWGWAADTWGNLHTL